MSLAWYDSQLSFKYIFHMHKQHHKMHKGEIVFHLTIPAVMFAIVAAMGYYILVLAQSMFRI